MTGVPSAHAVPLAQGQLYGPRFPAHLLFPSIEGAHPSSNSKSHRHKASCFQTILALQRFTVDRPGQAGGRCPGQPRACADPYGGVWQGQGLSCSTAPCSHAGQLCADVWQQYPQGLSEGTGEATPDTMKML